MKRLYNEKVNNGELEISRIQKHETPSYRLKEDWQSTDEYGRGRTLNHLLESRRKSKDSTTSSGHSSWQQIFLETMVPALIP
jgi:hypothetical protein